MSVLESPQIRALLSRAGLAELPPRVLAGALCVALLVCGAGVWRFWPRSPVPEVAFDQDAASPAEAGLSASSGEDSSPLPEEVVVHVTGAVMRPGVYRLAPGSRAIDAVEAAGGVIGDAAPQLINMARILLDGEQIVIPTREEVEREGAQTGPLSGGAPEPGPGGLVNLNRATAAELEALPGVGPATAAKIVTDRESNGPFAAPEDLMRVPGIGPKKFEALKDLVVTR